MHKCENPLCNNLTDNPKFCSSSCAARVNNVNFPKRSLEGKCAECGKPISKTRKYCTDHNPCIPQWDNMTLGEIRLKRKYQPHSRIRSIARKVYLRSSRPKACEKCGYSLVFHVCHIKPIHMFTEDTMLSVINDLENLIALCPNHHWELDNGYLSI